MGSEGKETSCHTQGRRNVKAGSERPVCPFSFSLALSQWLKGDAPEKVPKLAPECNTGLERSREDAKRQRYEWEFCLQAGHDAPSQVVGE
ncbi:hypothetical protein E2C01_041501 [Portunus trituberculatus]|uniref:Uncharacterized protein n=1 Tax=Portunus trituberculatus TaxID=210409 RepID=A0A5B7FQT2_PORTR|nr:hypothetical protein [Portunus trituberculatus]